MIIILAGCHDTVASTPSRCWRSHDVRVLTARDLSRSGWRYFPDDLGSSTAVIGGEEVAVRDIDGVLTRLIGIPQQELGHIVAADRTYVAVEMTAFLIAWLTSLPVPVLNRPTPPSLGGPAWRRERWTAVAAGMGIPVSIVQRREYVGARHEVVEKADNVTRMTVVGKHCLGEGHPTLAHQARQLATAAGVDLLAVDFSSPEPGAMFLGADVFPDVMEHKTAQAVLKYFQEERNHAT